MPPGREPNSSFSTRATDYDPARAAAIAEGREPATVDAALSAAMATRWSGDLTIAEWIARTQLQRVLAKDLTSQQRDWPERVSRAAYELTQALVWQGKYYAADDVCRTAHMRVSGAKWTAWEFAMRATVRFAHGDYVVAGRHFAQAEKILDLEGFGDFALTIITGRSACLRAQGDLDGAAEHLSRAEAWPRKGRGSAAAILAERAELRTACGDSASAADDWHALCGASLPLWRGIAFLRLAETGDDPATDGRKAMAAFGVASSAWGLIRTRALLEGQSAADVTQHAAALGPPTVFTPSRPWLM